ncbi:unnamed protein product [Gongylonema pulchrum]|uniref:BPI2 domain-containing protein n=1 Tax=Gongylonema pulchrum TaxID=637853 RepID=A0A183DVJ1_9BILA|nr:unnamed protein product [Gongylonema pulchrum]
MRMRGGSVQLQGFYRAVYRTIREGELAANLSSFAINLKFKISTTFAGKLLLENVVCDAEVRVVDVQLVPKLHDLVDEGLRTALDEHTSVVISVPYLQKFPEDKSKMVYIYITEFVLNSFLKKLDTFGNTALLLSAVPEFDGLLQLNCSENLECMGDFLQDAEPYQFDSGTMLLKMRSPAVATLRDGFMLLDLNLKVTVSYVQDGVDVNVLEFDWLLTVRINNAFLNEHLVSKDEAVRITNATLSLVELKMSGVTPYVEMVPNFTEHLQRLIVSRRKALEKLLTEQCSLITVIPDTAYEAVSRTGAFRNRTMLIATDMEWTPEHFSLFS